MSRQLTSLQQLRATAALLVAAFHYEAQVNVILGRDPYVSGFFSWFGFIGVDLFFVISGFVIWRFAAEARERSGFRTDFLLKRAARVYLPYWGALSFVLIFGLGSPHGKFLTSAVLYPQPVERLILPVAWTLVFEMGFYLFVWSILFCDGSLAKRKWLLSMLAVVVFTNALLYAHGIWTSSEYNRFWSRFPNLGLINGDVLRHLSSPYILEFGAGAILAYRLDRRAAAWIANSTGLRIITSTAVLLFALTMFISIRVICGNLSNSEYLTLVRVALCGSCAVLIVATAVSVDVSAERDKVRSKLSRLMSWVGDGSYSVYLLHTAFFEIGVRLGLREWAARNVIPGLACAAVYFVLTVALSALIGNRIERPIYNRVVCGIDKRRRRVSSGEQSAASLRGQPSLSPRL
jgi:peptidoglycan/LPS O-acetylase OafA/YrhL